MIEKSLCADCVWFDAKNQSCDATGRCVRRPSNAPTLDPDEYDLFPADELSRLRRQLDYEREYGDDPDELDQIRRQYEYELRMEE